MQMLLQFLQRVTGLLLALSFSTTLWVIIVNQQNQTSCRELAESTTVEVINTATDLVLVSELPPVRLNICTAEDHRPRLRAENFRAWIDLRDAPRGTREYAIQTAASDRLARIESASPSAVTVRLDALTRREVPVRVTIVGRPPEGFSADDRATVSPERVTVTGGQSQVDTVDVAEVTLRLDGVREKVSQSVRPAPLNAAGAEVRGVTVTQTVLVELPVERQYATKVTPVRPQLVGTVRQGYQIVSIDVNPPAVAVVGEPNAIEGLTALNTVPVDVRNSSADILRPFDVVLPTGVSLVRREQVTVHVGIRPLEGSQTLRVAPSVLNVPEGYDVSVSRGSVGVTLAGPEPVLSALRPEDVRVSLDMTDYEPGSYTLIPDVAVPATLRVVSLDPTQLDITLRDRAAQGQ